MSEEEKNLKRAKIEANRRKRMKLLQCDSVSASTGNLNVNTMHGGMEEMGLTRGDLEDGDSTSSPQSMDHLTQHHDACLTANSSNSNSEQYTTAEVIVTSAAPITSLHADSLIDHPTLLPLESANPATTTSATLLSNPETETDDSCSFATLMPMNPNTATLSGGTTLQDLIDNIHPNTADYSLMAPPSAALVASSGSSSVASSTSTISTPTSSFTSAINTNYASTNGRLAKELGADRALNRPPSSQSSGGPNPPSSFNAQVYDGVINSAAQLSFAQIPIRTEG